MKNIHCTDLYCLKSPSKKHLLRAMKITTFLLFVCVFCTMAGNVSSQNVKVSIKKTNVPLEEVLNEIERQTDYLFVYKDEVNAKQPVSVNVSDKPVAEVLRTVLKMAYQMEGKHIILSAKEDRSLSAEIPQSDNRIILSGRVTDALGEPVIGATVLEKGVPANGTITDFEGNFSLKVSKGAGLVVTYIGYIPQEVKATGEGKLHIQLKEDTKTLDEVVVVGFGTQKKQNLTGAVSQVQMDKVLGDRPLTSVSSVLQGTMPGLTIEGGSAPGASKTLNIRGINSINGGSPLVLIDNVPGDIDMLNPADIESVSVLKDAASAAIYGARGAFGVILITTKKAKTESRLTLNYNTNFGFTKPISQLKQPDLVTILECMQQWDDNNNYYAQEQDYDQWKGYIRDYREGTLLQKYPGSYLEDGRFVPKGDTKYYYLQATNPQDAIYDDYGFQQTHNVSASGGTKMLTYRTSFSFTDQDGPLVSSKDIYRRSTVSSYVGAQITKWMHTSLDIKYSKSVRKYAETDMIYNKTGLPVWYPVGDIPKSTDLEGQRYSTNTPVNALNHTKPSKWNTDNPRIFFKTVFTPLKGLEAALEYTYDKNGYSKNRYDADVPLLNAEMGLVALNPTPQYRMDESKDSYNSLNIYGSYSLDIGTKHHTKVMVGFNQDKSDYKSLWVIRKDMINPDQPSVSGATGETTSGDEYTQYALRSGFFRLNYNYDEKYLLEVNGRYDGSSKFPKGSRYGIFPSVSIGWNLAKESFMRSADHWLNESKLRLTWGKLGNQSIKAYSFIPQMNSVFANWLVDGMKPTSLSMPGLVSSSFGWEDVITTDIGFDFAFLNNRLTGTFDWYRRDTKGMLAPGSEIPSTAGTTAPLRNTADLRTKGWELSVAWRDQIGDWRYGLGFNIYDSRTHITKYDNEAGLLTKDMYRAGQELGEIWGYVSDGYYTVDDFVSETVGATWKLKEGVTGIKGNNKLRPGDVKFKNLNDYQSDFTNVIDDGNDTAYNPGDRKIIGNNTPRYQFGLQANVGWKGFDVSVLFQGTGKRDYWYEGDLRFPMASAFGTFYTDQLDFWTPKSVDIDNPDYYQPTNPNATFARIYNKNDNGASNNRVQTKYLLNASYVRLKNLSVGYKLPDRLMKGIGLQNLRLFFSGENMATFSKLPVGVDPERLSWGYPFFSTYSFGFSVNI